MRAIFILAIGAVLCWGASPADGSGCYTPRVQVRYGYNYGHYNYGYHAVQKVYVAAYQPVYPAYAIGYGAYNGSADLEKEVLKLRLEVKGLEIQQLKGQLQQQQSQPPNGNPPQQGEPLPLKTSMVAAKCASCHDEKRHKDSGNGLLLIKDGGIGHLDAQTRLKSVQQILAGKMPKGGRLSNDEASALIVELSGK